MFYPYGGIIWGRGCLVVTHLCVSLLLSGIVGSTTGTNSYVRILSTLDRELLKPSASVALHKISQALVDILPPEADSTIAMLGLDERPDVCYSDIGGLDVQKQEIREAVELPLTHFELYRQVCHCNRSSPPLTPSTSPTPRLGLTHHAESSCTGPLDVVRRCLPKLWHTTPRRPSSELLGPSLCRSTSAKDPAWSGTCSDWCVACSVCFV